MRQAVIGLVAHVDAGKTTLAEALLHRAGALRRLGRVDHGDSFLDTDEQERRRGITIFSKQAALEHGGVRVTLLDTPGHVDFAAEAERTMRAFDYAIFVVGANDGVTGHARTLWRLLGRYGVPTLVFVNKMDLVGDGADGLLDRLRVSLGDRLVVAETLGDATAQEALAMADEEALDEYLLAGGLSAGTVRRLVAQRKAFPCFLGAALREEGVDALLDGIDALVDERVWPSEFAARVFRVSHDSGGGRVSWLKLTGGSLAAKDRLSGVGRDGAWTDKVDQIRVYHGERYEAVPRAVAGEVCAVAGLDHVLPGNALGVENGVWPPVLAPVLSYRVESGSSDTHAVYEALRELAEEDPLLGVAWREGAREVSLQPMGPVQIEVVRELLARRHGIEVSFGSPAILYRETIAAPVVGIGHFEPLRHYAEVHLLLEPTARGSGLSFGTVCPEDDLDRNWQRLILTNAMEREHVGTLVGAPVTDLRITLVAGRAHASHTEGGDFRQATYRAIRQALMQARGVLLEPWYHFDLGVPADMVGRALADLQRMGARFGAPDVTGGTAVVTGEVPASEVGDYPVTVAGYTGGVGWFSCEFACYDACHDAERVIEAAAYDAEADLANTPDSVFCSHGAGYQVGWREVATRAHLRPDPSRRRPWREADPSFFSA